MFFYFFHVFHKKGGKLFANTKIMLNFVFQSAFRFKQIYLKSNIYAL
jgi:hypothetical protein